jgi:hypothetical protein
MNLLPQLLLALSFTSVAHAAPELDSGDSTGWRLVGAYDATAAMATIPDQALGYVWQSADGMNESCGPSKSPVGMGVFEAEAVANGLSPTLAILLERTGTGQEHLTPDDVRVALGNDEPDYILQPMVEPRFISVSIEGEGALRYKQLVRTQLEMELCMEHKVGRGWTGADGDSLRQAFLLDPPDFNRPDRRYFGGQKEPVPGLLGPSDACLVRQPGFTDRSTGSGQGEGSIHLVPSDVWGATLRWCRMEERPSSPILDREVIIPLNISGLDELPVSLRRYEWKQLAVDVGSGQVDEDIMVDVSYAGDLLLEEGALFPENADKEDEDDVRGLTDVLALVPHTYPAVGPPEELDRYVLLLVPNWQLVEGIRRLRPQDEDVEADASVPQARVAEGLRNGVSWILDHPEMLFVQVEGADSGDDNWRDLTQAMGEEYQFLGLTSVETYTQTGWTRNWGYTSGLLAGRQPIVLPVDAVPTWEQASTAQRARQQSYVLLGMVMVVGFMIIGIRRIPELWSTVPEERADYWPARKGKDEEVEEEEVDGPGRNIAGGE